MFVFHPGGGVLVFTKNVATCLLGVSVFLPRVGVPPSLPADCRGDLEAFEGLLASGVGWVKKDAPKALPIYFWFSL